MFGKKPDEVVSLSKIRSGVEEFEQQISFKQQKLEDLFVVVKEAILRSQNLSLDHLHVLLRQVSHILSVARAIGDSSLEQAFVEEQQVLVGMCDLLEKYPSMDVANSADLQAALKNLRGMLSSQQDMIFSHKEILTQEKRRLVQILSEAEQLESDVSREHVLASSSNTPLLH
jgi:hypothetical protein